MNSIVIQVNPQRYNWITKRDLVFVFAFDVREVFDFVFDFDLVYISLLSSYFY